VTRNQLLPQTIAELEGQGALFEGKHSAVKKQKVGMGRRKFGIERIENGAI